MSYDSKSCSKCDNRHFRLCPSCKGTGYSSNARISKCSTWSGKGGVPCPSCNPGGSKYGRDPYA